MNFLLIVFAYAMCAQNVFAKEEVGEGPLVDAIDVMVEEFQEDLKSLELKSKKTSITSISTSESISPDIKGYLRTKLEGSSGAELRFVQCRSCQSVRAETQGNQVFLKKGLTTQKEVRQVTRQLGVSSYTEANLSYSGLRVLLTLNNFDSQTGELSWSKKYDARMLSIGKRGFKTSIGIDQYFSGRDFPAGLQLGFLERIYGIGEVGITLIATQQSGAVRNYFALGPSIGLNINQLGGWFWRLGELVWVLRVQYGWYGGDRDFSGATGLKFLFGSFYHLGLGYQQGFALEASEKKDAEGNDAAAEDSSEAASNKSSEGAWPASLVLGFGVDLG